MTTADSAGAAGAEGANDAGGAGGAEDKSFKVIESQDDLDRIVQQRLARERAKFADYDDLKTKASQFDELQESQKSEAQRQQERAAQLEREATESKLAAARLEVALEKGLTAVQARRLVGTSKEELASDADELLASFKTTDDSSTPPRRPQERLTGGGDPTVEPEETDPRKLAEGVRRY